MYRQRVRVCPYINFPCKPARWRPLVDVRRLDCKSPAYLPVDVLIATHPLTRATTAFSVKWTARRKLRHVRCPSITVYFVKSSLLASHYIPAHPPVLPFISAQFQLSFFTVRFWFCTVFFGLADQWRKRTKFRPSYARSIALFTARVHHAMKFVEGRRDKERRCAVKLILPIPRPTV